MTNPVTIRGQHFKGVGFEHGPTSVHLGPTNGPTNVTDLVVVSDTEMTCTLPDKVPGWPNVVSLWVTTPLGTVQRAGAFTFQPPLPFAISSISPSQGDYHGGTTIYINGSQFTDLVRAEFDCFGSIIPLTIVSHTDKQIVCTTSAGPQYTPFGVRVVTAQGETTYRVNNASNPAWSYVDLTPVFDVTSIVPSHGSMMGGYDVTVYGSLLSEIEDMMWAALSAVSSTAVDDNSLTIHVPQCRTIFVDPGTTTFIEFYRTGYGPWSSIDFTFDPFVATGQSLTDVTALGGEVVSVYGTSLDATDTIDVDGTGVTATVVSDTEVQFTTPAHAAGSVTVTLTSIALDDGGGDLSGPYTTTITINFG